MNVTVTWFQAQASQMVSIMISISTRTFMQLPIGAWRKAHWFATMLRVRPHTDRNLAYLEPTGPVYILQ